MKIFLGLFVTALIIAFTSVLAVQAVNYEKNKLDALKRAIASVLANRKFRIDKQFFTSHCLLYLDHGNKQGAFFGFLDPQKSYKTPVSELRYFALNQITECALVQDGTMVHYNAVVAGMAGAALFGLGGAVAGATAMNNAEHGGHISVRVLLNDDHMPSLTITVMNASIKKSEPAYLEAFENAQKIYNEFEGIVRMNQRNQGSGASQGASAQTTAAQRIPTQATDPHQDVTAENARILEQINHLAQMQKEGILTADEFSEKKKMLLDRLV